MNKLITLCRDIEGPTSTDCIDDHEELEEPLVAPCKVVRMDQCDTPAEEEYVGPEAESSAVWLDMEDKSCCDC